MKKSSQSINKSIKPDMTMKAQVQCFVAAAAADISEHSNLQKLLVSRKVEVTRYEAV